MSSSSSRLAGRGGVRSRSAKRPEHRPASRKHSRFLRSLADHLRLTLWGVLGRLLVVSLTLWIARARKYGACPPWRGVNAPQSLCVGGRGLWLREARDPFEVSESIIHRAILPFKPQFPSTVSSLYRLWSRNLSTIQSHLYTLAREPFTPFAEPRNLTFTFKACPFPTRAPVKAPYNPARCAWRRFLLKAPLPDSIPASTSWPQSSLCRQLAPTPTLLLRGCWRLLPVVRDGQN
jgi:hypothetical protein